MGNNNASNSPAVNNSPLRYNDGFFYSLLFVVSVALASVIFFGDPKSISILTSEDNFIENLTAVLWILGAVTSAIAIYKKKYVFFASLWLALCILFFGEETSWLQRVFGYSVPVVENMSNQSEFNIHNLNWPGERFIDADGNLRLTISNFFTSQTIFRIGFITYFFILPLMLAFTPLKRKFNMIDFPRFDSFFWVLCGLPSALQQSSHCWPPMES